MDNKPIPIHSLHNSRNRRGPGGMAQRVFVGGGDGRSAWAIRWKDLIAAHVADLGGAEGLSEAQLSLCRRAATMEIALEEMETRMSEGQKVDIGLYARLTTGLTRLLELLGAKRQTKSVDPTGALAAALKRYERTDADEDELDSEL